MKWGLNVGSKKNKKDDIIVTFMGESRNDVTGSSVLINVPKKDRSGRYNILIEMGLVQGGKTIEQDLANNRRMLERFNKELIGSIETVFVAHQHCDHCGNLPYLTANGFEGNVITTRESVPIMRDLIEDSVKIHQGNIQKLKELKGKRVKEFYNTHDMYSLFEKIEYKTIGEKYRLNDEIEYRFIHSGHVLGGAMLELWITKPNNCTKHLVYTSDIGSNYNNQFQYFVEQRDELPNCNLLISEATYNNPNRSWTKKDAIEERKQLKQEIKEGLQSNKEILFSSFSFGRTQNLMCMLYDFFNEEEWFNEYEVVLDGVLLHKINNDYCNVLQGEELEYFNRVLRWKNLKLNKEYAGTKMILTERKPRIVIATSGFLTNGRIVSYLQSLVSSSKAVIYLTGYCGGEGSLGYRLLNPEQKTITIEKMTLIKRAKIRQLKTFSSHIQYDELISFLKSANCDKVLIHHSSDKDKYEFGETLREEFRKSSKSTKVDVVSDKNNQFIL